MHELKGVSGKVGWVVMGSIRGLDRRMNHKAQGIRNTWPGTLSTCLSDEEFSGTDTDVGIRSRDICVRRMQNGHPTREVWMQNRCRKHVDMHVSGRCRARFRGSGPSQTLSDGQKPSETKTVEAPNATSPSSSAGTACVGDAGSV